MLAPKAEKYPLTMLTSHSFHRQHTSQDNNPWHRDELRHAVHINVVDAKGRAIKDGDLVHVYNDKGEVIGIVTICEDITDLKQAEQSLKRSESLETVYCGSHWEGCEPTGTVAVKR